MKRDGISIALICVSLTALCGLAAAAGTAGGGGAGCEGGGQDVPALRAQVAQEMAEAEALRRDIRILEENVAVLNKIMKPERRVRE